MRVITKWLVREPQCKAKGCVLALPGRGVPATAMMKLMGMMGLTQSLRISVEPKKRAWYPAPNGVGDQEAAIAGLRKARADAWDVVERVRDWGYDTHDIVIIGFSAGGVVALNLVTTGEAKFAGCFCLSGAILEPEKVQKCRTETPIWIQHNAGDETFKWGERYLPMKKALLDNGYAVTNLERPGGGEHTIYREDITEVGQLIRKALKY